MHHGFNIKENADFSIDVDQTNYVNGITPIMLTNDRIKYTSSPLTDKERSQYCQLIGQLNCITNMVKLEFSFEVCYASTIVNSGTIFDIINLNKVIKYIKSEKLYIKFPSLNIDSLSVRIYTDTNFINFPSGGSQGGQIIFITGNKNQSCTLAWNSSKIKHAVQSNLAAETLSITNGNDVFLHHTHIFQQHNINSIVITDNKSQLDCVQSAKLISDKRPRVELHALHQMHEKNGIKIVWIPTSKQISKVLTKEDPLAIY